MTTKPYSLRITDAAEYDRAGYVVEQYRYVNYSDGLVWAVPGWFEDRWGESGFFDTAEKAGEFIEMVSDEASE